MSSGVMMGKQTVVVRADEVGWDSRSVYTPERYGAVRWKNLLSGELTASEALTMGLAELPPGARFVRHWHAQPETYFFTDGVGLVEVEGLEYEVGVGTAVFIPGNAWHQVKNTGEGPLRLVYTFPADSFQEIVYHYETGE
jgi:quercetin dioxygenase-like cupin family protein